MTCLFKHTWNNELNTEQVSSYNSGQRSAPTSAYGFDVGLQNMRLINWLREISTWDKLHTFGSSKILRSSYVWFFFVPIAAKLLSQFNFPMEFTLWGKLHTFDPTLPFSWLLLYLASLILSAASLGYSIRCPSLIKKYKTFSHYYQDGNGYMKIGSTIVEASNILEDETNREELVSMIKVALIHTDQKTETFEKLAKDAAIGFFPKAIQILPREELGDLFSLVSKASGQLYPKWRLSLLLLYFTGFTIMGTLFIQNIISVIKIIK